MSFINIKTPNINKVLWEQYVPEFLGYDMVELSTKVKNVLFEIIRHRTLEYLYNNQTEDEDEDVEDYYSLLLNITLANNATIESLQVCIRDSICAHNTGELITAMKLDNVLESLKDLRNRNSKTLKD